VRGDIRGAAVSGSSPGSPHAVDREDIATGGGADGEGELVPPPLSLTLQAPCSLPALSRPAFSRQATRTLSAGTLPSHPALSQGIPIRSLPAPSPLIQHSHRGYPYALCRPPLLSSSTLTGDTHTLSAGPLLSHPVLSQGIPIRSLPAPPPRPRLRRSSPAPATGAWAVRGDIRGAAVSGVEPVGSRIRLFSRISPCTGPWGYRHGGWGRRGGGTSSPSPVSHAPELCTSHRSSPPAFLRGMPVRSLPAAPTPPAPSALLPRPRRGGVGSAWRYQGGSRARLFSGISPCTGPWGYRHGGWG